MKKRAKKGCEFNQKRCEFKIFLYLFVKDLSYKRRHIKSAMGPSFIQGSTKVLLLFFLVCPWPNSSSSHKRWMMNDAMTHFRSCHAHLGPVMDTRDPLRAQDVHHRTKSLEMGSIKMCLGTFGHIFDGQMGSSKIISMPRKKFKK
jgi:hypothetical protein